MYYYYYFDYYNYNRNSYYDNDDSLIELISVHCNSSKASNK